MSRYRDAGVAATWAQGAPPSRGGGVARRGRLVSPNRLHAGARTRAHGSVRAVRGQTDAEAVDI
ncbi:hypothetical protein V6G44_000423 [Burkholderia multivorans]|uniref:Uncharacterized protein n=2 Tax=Burkholderia multivorans TaxID=87883 RepID=A0A8E2RZK1_9BURK|nr:MULTISPECIES: hypothetical protein [Burkholderia]OFT83345.1 hypothetical protein HMPREF3115_19710 [Burkholderia sp. HMSC10F09]AOJ95529.1 hypothetical protein WK22_21635 [Burkholderia multivorans]AVR19117.1 hypothetical protein A8H40_06620 [Burkholderia multivorans]EEE09392.1 hypothetical protein BURMUCGD2_4765 [Burkholderia multivorans CGD2]EEE15310.1 hypothetical protein BURMUCGD2M_4753 [Burkholderia multivorans CGD2M]